MHYPETSEGRARFDARVAKFHAEYVAEYIEKLNCPVKQKQRLLDEVVRAVLDGCGEMEKAR